MKFYIQTLNYLQKLTSHFNHIRLVDLIRNEYPENHPSINNRAYRRLGTLLEDFEGKLGRNIYSDSFNDRTSEAWLEYLHTAIPQRKRNATFMQSTIRNFYQKTISILYKAARYGYTIKIESLKMIRIQSVDTFSIYLSDKEVEILANLRLPPGQSVVRDLFVIGCCTALRYSDVIRLRPENFSEEKIMILTQKTKTRVEIPIHYLIRKIIERNKGFSFLNPSFSNWYFNAVLKKICRKANLVEKVLVERVEGGKIVHSLVEKWRLVSSHTARRSGATNMFLHGIVPYRIMMVTGHNTESSFFHYLRITASENVKMLQDNSFFTGVPATPHDIPINQIYNHTKNLYYILDDKPVKKHIPFILNRNLNNLISVVDQSISN